MLPNKPYQVMYCMAVRNSVLLQWYNALVAKQVFKMVSKAKLKKPQGLFKYCNMKL